MFVAESGCKPHMVKSIKNKRKLQEAKTVVKTGKNKTTMGSLQGDWKGYHKRDGKFYPVMCTDTSYILD